MAMCLMWLQNNEQTSFTGVQCWWEAWSLLLDKRGWCTRELVSSESSLRFKAWEELDTMKNKAQSWEMVQPTIFLNIFLIMFLTGTGCETQSSVVWNWRLFKQGGAWSSRAGGRCSGTATVPMGCLSLQFKLSCHWLFWNLKNCLAI